MEADLGRAGSAVNKAPINQWLAASTPAMERDKLSIALCFIMLLALAYSLGVCYLGTNQVLASKD